VTLNEIKEEDEEQKPKKFISIRQNDMTSMIIYEESKEQSGKKSSDNVNNSGEPESNNQYDEMAMMFLSIEARAQCSLIDLFSAGKEALPKKQAFSRIVRFLNSLIEKVKVMTRRNTSVPFPSSTEG